MVLLDGMKLNPPKVGSLGGQVLIPLMRVLNIFPEGGWKKRQTRRRRRRKRRKTKKRGRESVRKRRKRAV